MNRAQVKDNPPEDMVDGQSAPGVLGNTCEYGECDIVDTTKSHTLRKSGLRNREKDFVRAVVESGGRDDTLQLATPSFFAVMASAKVEVSGMLEIAPLGSSDFLRLARAGTDSEVSVCSTSISSVALRFLESPFVIASVAVLISAGCVALSPFSG